MKSKKNRETSMGGVSLAIIATLFARGIGFLRELVMAKVFGTSALGDAFIVAFSVPDILVSGFSLAVATLFIPTYYVVKKNEPTIDAVNKYNTSVLMFVCLIGVGLTGMVEMIPQTVIKLFAQGFSKETLNIATFLLRIIAFSIVPIFCGGLFKSYGQIVNKYATLVFCGMITNITVIIALLIFGANNMRTLAYSVVIGNSAYAVIAYLVIKRSGYTIVPKMTIKNKYLNNLIIGIVPVFISNIIAEVNQIIDKNFASRLATGTISALNYSSKIINLVTAILGTAISSVLFPKLSVIATEGKKDQLAEMVVKINSYVLAIILPIFYMILFGARLIIKILFQRGSFDNTSAMITSQCLMFYAIGVIGFNLKAIWVRVYNASLDTKTPAVNSALAVVINIFLNIGLIRILQHRGLALATGVSSVITDYLLIINYKNTNSKFKISRLYGEWIKIVGCSLCFLPILSIYKLKNNSYTIENYLFFAFLFMLGCICYLLILTMSRTVAGDALKIYVKKLGNRMKGQKMVELIKEVVFFSLNWIRMVAYGVCTLFPKKKNYIFINCFDGRGYGDNPKYIVEELKKQNIDVHLFWVYRGKNMVKGVTYVYPFSIKAIYLQAVSQIWISTVRMPYYSIKRKGQVYIHTWHAGLAFKKVENECPGALSRRYLRIAKKDSKMIDYYISANEDNTRLFERYFFYAGGAILKYGAPRNDIFFKGDLDREEYKKKLFGPIKEKIAVYAPTFRKSKSLEYYTINFNMLQNALKNKFGGEWKIVIRLHPRIASEAKKFIQYNENVLDGSAIDDVQELLVIADVLITDYSSIALDYINSQKPVFIYATDMEEYRRDRDFHVELTETPFSIATNNDELEQNIEMFSEKNYLEKVAEFKQKYGFYINSKFGQKITALMEKEINDFGIASMFWEEFYAKHMRELTFYKREFPKEQILEFDSIEDLRKFDSEFLLNVDSEIITNICTTLKCKPNDITTIEVINAGLTNVSFAFSCGNQKYVYRHPGGTAGNLIDRQTELFAQMAAKEAGIDKSVIHMDISGWKISYFVKDAKNCDFEGSDEHLEVAMNYLHKLHAVETDKTVKIFDNIAEGKRLMTIASATKGNLAREFTEIIEKIDRLYPLVKADAERLEYGLVLCHNDTYGPNYLYDINGEVYLIDWEYAGLNYAANDIGCILCRYDWTDDQIERYLKAYVGHELTEDEHRYYMAFIPISAFYWFCWGLYKGSVGDDDSFFFLPSYRNLVRFIDRALNSYEK